MLDVVELFVSCAKGLEYILADELAGLGGKIVKTHPAGVRVGVDQRGISRICLWSRIANRVLLPLAETRKANRNSLYEMASRVQWDDYLDPGEAYWIAAFGQAGSIKHSGFGAQVVNDAVKDKFRELELPTPVIDQRLAKQTLQLNIGRTITLSVDLAGRSLHQRGYRQDGELAPLKENLAAALLVRAGWPRLCAAERLTDSTADTGVLCLLDPMCGSGTLVIEGAMMALDIAPGLYRPQFAFLNARWIDCDSFQQELAEAQRRAVIGKRRWQGKLVGADVNSAAIRSARRNLARADLARWIDFKKADATATEPAYLYTGKNCDSGSMAGSDTPPINHSRLPESHRFKGLVICNPPYGERLGQELALRALYQRFGRQLKARFAGWSAAVFTGSLILAKELGLRAEKEYKFFNGKLPASLYLFSIYAINNVEKADDKPTFDGGIPDGGIPDGGIPEKPNNLSGAQQKTWLSPSAQMLANRLQKNSKQLQRWVSKEGLQAYRLYDADIPEYAVAIDRYADAVCIQEYAPPKHVDVSKARQRILDVLDVVPVVLKIPNHRVFFKQRKRQKGAGQYPRQQRKQQELVVEEYGCKFLVNLSDFLDTGLFLDHRPIRKYIQEQASGKRFLNLFCYTATASIHAANSGADTTNIDLSKTYLAWAEKNFQLNGLLGTATKQAAKKRSTHRFERANVLTWIAQCRERFDLVFLDPPTFSNSKSMASELDIQRDHAALIKAVMKLLVADGQLIFSTNFRRFKLDPQLEAQFDVIDKTAFSLPADFARRRIHQCWFIAHKTR